MTSLEDWRSVGVERKCALFFGSGNLRNGRKVLRNIDLLCPSCYCGQSYRSNRAKPTDHIISLLEGCQFASPRRLPKPGIAARVEVAKALHTSAHSICRAL